MTVAWFRHRPARVPAWVVDAGWAVAVAIAVTIAIRAGTEPGARPRDLLAYALGWTIGALLLARRRWPVGVLMASFVTLQLYYVLDYPGISSAVPLAVALYTAGAAGHLRWALLVAAVAVGGGIVFLLFVNQEPVLPVLSELVREVSLWLAILLLGDAVHSRRALAREHRLLEVERARSEGLLRQRHVGPWQLDQPRPGEVLGQVAAVLHRHELDVPPMQHQRWRLDHRQDGPQVNFQHGAQERLGGPGAGAGALQLGVPTAKPLLAGAAGRHHRGNGLGAHSSSSWATRASATSTGIPDRVVVAGHPLGRGVGQDECAGALRSRSGEEQRHRAGVKLDQERDPRCADLVQDHRQLLGIRLPRRQGIGRGWVRGARAPAVEQDHPGEGR
jgi:hypothetical protein